MVGCQGSRGTEKRECVARLPNDETELYRILAEHIRDGIYILDREGYFTYVNDVIVRRSGYPPGWFYERTYLDVIRPGDREKTEQNFRALIEGRKVDSYEVAYPTSSGRVLWVEVNTSPIVRDGEVIGLLGLSRDVTARKEVERALAESEQLFRGLAEQAPMGVAILKDYEVRYINEAGAHVFGSPVGQIMEWGQEGLLNHVHPADLPAVVEHAQGLLRGEIEVLRNFIYRIIQDSGEIRWVEQYASRITFHGESAVLMSFVDITDRIHAEEALRRSENLYRSTIDAMMDPLHVVESDLTIVLHNRRLVEWARDVGVETDFLGRRIFDVFPFLPRRVRQEYEMVFRMAQTLRTRESTRICGRELFTETLKIPVLASDGSVERVITVLHDITEMTLWNKALAESEEKYRCLFEMAIDPIFIHDLDGRILDVNEMAVRRFGYSKEEFLRMSVFDLHPPGGLERAREAFARIMVDGVVSFTIEFRGRDGKTFTGEVHATMLEIGGNSIIQGTVRILSPPGPECDARPYAQPPEPSGDDPQTCTTCGVTGQDACIARDGPFPLE